ncbi:MAG TPA: NADP transhydrogenase subunit alpha, partial [Bacteroidota bacterium]|nr:NADP transhydrogenase subunit alpha [Bacteroidota bacterium]
VSRKKDYFISIDDPGGIRPERILKTIVYEHPLYTTGAVAAQNELRSLNKPGPVYFCGSYFRYGFHEDAFTSALGVSEDITGGKVW